MSPKDIRGSRLAVAGVTLSLVTLVASACGTPDSAGSNGGNGQIKRGGTITILMQQDFEHLDPARSYVGQQISTGRLYAPTLTTFKTAPGVAGNDVVSDSATDTGTHNADFTQWSFTVRDGLKWQDGKDVTCEDFKYGVERSFSDLLTDGTQYNRQYLAGGDKYKGIYEQPQGLPSVTCNGKTITYKLSKPVTDFNYTVTMPTFAAVRKDKDTKTKYDTSFFSYGPYQIQNYTRDQQLVLVRNKYWDQSKDTVRKNYPDTFKFVFGVDENVITDRLIQDRGADQGAVSSGVFVSAQQAPQVLQDPKLKARTVSGLTQYVYYVWINTTKIKDLKCRQAYEYSIDKTTYLTAFGGPTFGQPATGIISPTLKAHKDFDLYGTKTQPQGDPAKAKQLLAQSPSCPRNITYDYRTNNAQDDKAAAAIKAAFARSGITVTANPIKRSEYYATIGKPALQHEIGFGSWGADWPSGSTVIPPLFDPRQIVPAGNQVFSQLNDPAITAGMDAAAKMSDQNQAQKAWGDLDESIQKQAATIPLRYLKTLLLHGSKVSGAFLDTNYAEINICSIGLTDTSVS
ncbi:ABC transporter substrate-binding protein [Fodinicola acaciae]|uniref:ABC transporter substrate-binding protein n=1 Tax=Fodinicola acaciae TaxID=2681555 RepID=UPI0013D89592|nr:ABC transporter substrate-binding protein [Fodinicola acaciae]